MILYGLRWSQKRATRPPWSWPWWSPLPSRGHTTRAHHLQLEISQQRLSGPRPEHSRKRTPHAAKKKQIWREIIGVYAGYEIIGGVCTQVTKLAAQTLCCSERRPLVVTSNSYGPLFGQERFSNGCNVGKTIGDQKAERQNYRVRRGQGWNKITIHLYIHKWGLLLLFHKLMWKHWKL